MNFSTLIRINIIKYYVFHYLHKMEYTLEISMIYHSILTFYVYDIFLCVKSTRNHLLY